MDDDVRAAVGGDRRAFTRLVERHRGAVCAVALGITGDVVTSEDVAQDVFVGAWRSLGSLRDPAAFRAWILESARNRARDLVRARAVRPVAPESALDDVADPAPSMTDRMVLEAWHEKFGVKTATLDVPNHAGEPSIVRFEYHGNEGKAR